MNKSETTDSPTTVETVADCSVQEGQATRKLFLSFPDTLRAMAAGHVNPADLDSGLFVFSCTREYFTDPVSTGHYVQSIITERPELHRQLVAAAGKAESESRLSWYTGKQLPLDRLNDFLTAHGYGRVITSDRCDGHYGRHHVEQQCRELQVI